MLQTLTLGVIQGLCEFLPVSSSGHLALLQNFFGFDPEGLLVFDLLLHCATMLVVLLFFREDIGRLMVRWPQGLFSRSARHKPEWTQGWAILLAVAVTGAIGLPLKGAVERTMASPLAIGAGLLVTAALLALVPLRTSESSTEKISWLKTALVIGLAQGLAVLPGVSRSGTTIAVGLFMGLGVEEAFRFSFLISIPAILGASLLEVVKTLHGGILALPVGWLWAVLAAFVLGWLALKLLHRLVITGQWAYFGLYCLFLGSAAVLSTLDIF